MNNANGQSANARAASPLCPRLRQIYTETIVPIMLMIRTLIVIPPLSSVSLQFRYGAHLKSRLARSLSR
jgi:hypothetical protein